VAAGVAALPETFHPLRFLRRRALPEIPGVLLFSVLGFLTMGYHPGLEDDNIYLAAVKADLNPSLFPYSAEFFRLQLQATVFDRWMADFVHLTRIPVAWAELIWQLASLFLILWAIKKIANRLFAQAYAQWSSVALVAAMFSLPVSGTALYLVDQHLHPRTLATAAILFAIDFIFARKWFPAAVLLLLALLLHPLMAAMGISFCVFLALALHGSLRTRLRWMRNSAAALVPLGWVFEPPLPGWRQALDTRTYYYLYKWTWYEWLGALGPLVCFFILWRVRRKHGDDLLARFSLAVFVFGVFHQVLAMALLRPAALVRVTPLQPMRYLHLVYFLFALVTGGMLGKYLLRRSAWRWAIFLLLANGGMYAAQRSEFSGSTHLELPGRQPRNEWLQAFEWIKGNTPVDAYFVLDPHYMEAAGEDYHGFRALAERSQLADAVKDAAVVTLVPELGPAWRRQVQAQQGWRRFNRADFERLKAEFGVTWALVYSNQTAGLDCKWHSRTLAVCPIP
jgi:hypothetical protein